MSWPRPTLKMSANPPQGQGQGPSGISMPTIISSIQVPSNRPQERDVSADAGSEAKRQKLESPEGKDWKLKVTLEDPLLKPHNECDISQARAEYLQTKRKMHEKEEKLNNALLQKISFLEQCLKVEKEVQSKQNEERAKDESEMRNLRRAIFDLKGSSRLFVLLHPFNGQQSNIRSPHVILDRDSKKFLIRESNGCSRDENYEFEVDDFDKVLMTDSSQDLILVFDEIGKLVQNTIDGYNSSIFSYGQSNVKTWSMEEGIIPRAFEKILKDTTSLEKKGWIYNIAATFLEVEKEEINDLFATENCLEYKLVRESDQFYVKNAKIETVTDSNFKNLLDRAKNNRMPSVSNFSSRSHLVFMLKLSGVNSFTNESCAGTLTVADHILFHENRITHLLIDKFGTSLFLANLSPRMVDLPVTLKTLRFAKQMKQCTLGK